VKRRANRTDENHADIRDALRAIGAYVVDCSHVGAGFPDLLVFWRGCCIPVEIKNPAKPKADRQLTPDQIIFHGEAKARGVMIPVVETIDEALAVLGARTTA